MISIKTLLYIVEVRQSIEWQGLVQSQLNLET